MEPIEASNLDNQYKYYWEGDLCGQASLEVGAAVGPALPVGDGQPVVPRQARPPHPPKTVPPSQDSAAERMMQSEACICMQL